MKTNSLPIKALLAVLAAIVLLPVSPAAATIAFTFTGLFAMLSSDYGQDAEPLTSSAGVIPFELPGRGGSELNRAA
jgi:hypothetical protein